MPTTYTHWRFGNECIETLPDQLKDIINQNRGIFNFGVHGPDIYFYYNCLKHNEVNQFGTNLHDIPFKETLKDIKYYYDTCEDKELAIAYLLGFCCHFTLDSYCHGFIDRKAEVSEFSHGRIESQLDKYFLIKDGFDPIKKSVTFSLKPTKAMAKVISHLLPNCDEDVTYKTMKDQVFYLNILKDNSDLKRKTLEKMMDAAKASDFKDLLITTNEYPDLEATMLRLDKLFNKAKEHYPTLAQSLFEYLTKNKALDPYFKNHFCPKADYKQIPILTMDTEINYVVGLQD